MPAHKIPLDEETIRRRYAAGESLTTIGDSLGVSRWTVRQYIPTVRPPWGDAKHCRIDREFIDGLLLGDGCLRAQKRGTTPYISVTQEHARAGWLDQITTELEQLGMVVHRTPSTGSCSILWTYAYADLMPERQRWYPRGKKIVPRDLVLTARCLAHWFFGDGCFSCRRRRADRQLKLCTNGFPRRDVAYLSRLISARFGFHFTQTKSNELALYRRNEIDAFQLLVRPFAPDCMLYKLDFAAYWVWRAEREAREARKKKERAEALRG